MVLVLDDLISQSYNKMLQRAEKIALEKEKIAVRQDANGCTQRRYPWHVEGSTDRTYQNQRGLPCCYDSSGPTCLCYREAIK